MTPEQDFRRAAEVALAVPWTDLRLLVGNRFGSAAFDFLGWATPEALVQVLDRLERAESGGRVASQQVAATPHEGEPVTRPAGSPTALGGSVVRP